MELWKIINIQLINISVVLLFLNSCHYGESLPLEKYTPECIVKRGFFFNKEKEYAIIVKESNRKETFIKGLDNPLYSLTVLVQDNSRVDTLFDVQGLPVDPSSINCEVEDYNFDHYKDIVITLQTSVRGDNKKSIFLYLPNKDSFAYVENSHLLHSLNVADSLKLIRADFEEFNDEIGGYSYRTYYYKCLNAKLILVDTIQ